jgi:YVTN family beta-propeller protein
MRNLIFFFITLCSLLPAILYAQWLETTIPVGILPGALCWNSTNNKIYCANYGSNNITIIDGETNVVITTIPVGDFPRALCWNSIQNRVYVANDNSTVSVIRDSIISGVEENHQPLSVDRLSFEVYPNPASSFFIIHPPLNAQNSMLRLFDVTGKIVKVEKIKGLKDQRISLDGMKNGVYFVQLGKEYKS